MRPSYSGADPDAVASRRRRLRLWAVEAVGSRTTAIVLTVLALGAGILTYSVLAGATPIARDAKLVLGLLIFDVALLLALGALVIWRLVKLWAERRAGASGARLHVRLVALFALLAVAPAITVAVLAALFFNFEVDTWFNERVRRAVDESVAVAEAYLAEHKRVVAADALAMSSDLRRQWTGLMLDPDAFDEAVQAQAALRSLSEAVVFDLSGRVLARAGLGFSLQFDPPPAWALASARDGQVVILTSGEDDRVRALVQLDALTGSYLFVGRYVDSKVLGHLAAARDAANQYEQLESRRFGLQITFATIFVIVALLLLVAAVGIGLTFALRLARPISELVTAAEQVRAGDLSVRVIEPGDQDELGNLIRAFNRMTTQLAEQRGELVEANRQLDDRRRFTETVLTGVTAGVIGLDPAARVNLPNQSASELLGTELERVIGRPLAEAVPEMAPLIAVAARRPQRLVEAQITLNRQGQPRTLLTRVAAQRAPGGKVQGYVVTFDDVSELEAAQRKAAWADIARRIAHEIKNPLTPIQLSAERLKRKYLGEITSDPKTFELCTDTIVRQVDDIGRMVDEFSSFARMPAPEMRRADVVALCRDAAFLQRNAHPDVAYDIDLPDTPVSLRCDARLLTQALINVLKNAEESLDERSAETAGAAGKRGRIGLSLALDGDRVALLVTDNGRGLPPEYRHQLTEPYVTTRSSGTGLGLAIVKKIMEDHGGKLSLADREGGGAVVRLELPLVANEEPTGDDPAADEAPGAETAAGQAGD